MAWSGITSAQLYSAGNALPVTNIGDELISVTVKRPASGEDVIVTFYADGAPVHTMTTSATDPIKTSAFSAPGATSLNYSTDRAFASPGASISASTEASAPSSTPSGDMAVAGAMIADSFELSDGSPVGGSSTIFGLGVMGSSTGSYGQAVGIMEDSADGWFGGGAAYGPLTVIKALTRSAMPLLANVCVGGTFIANQQMQFDALKAIKPSHVFFFVGSNDLHGGATVTEVWTVLKAWADEGIAWGATPMFYIPHIRTSQTAAIAEKLLKFRNTIINYCGQLVASGVPAYYLDALTVIADPTSSVLTSKAMTLDTSGTPGVHATNYGAALVGLAGVDIFDTVSYRRPPHKPLIGYDVSTTIPEKLSNPRFAGTNGSAPTSWFATPTWQGSAGAVTHGFILAPEGHNIWRMTFTAVTAGDYVLVSQNAVTRLGAAAWGTAGITAKIVSGAQYVRNLALSVGLSAAGAKAEVFSQGGTAANRMPFTPLEGKPLYFDTERFYVPASYNGSFGLTVTAYAAGEIVLDIEAPYLEAAQIPWTR